MTSKNVVLKIQSPVINLSAFYYARFVCDLDKAIKAIDTRERFSAAKFFLLCLSIEMSMKSCLLSVGCSKKEAWGHDLGILLEMFSDKVKRDLLTDEDKQVILKTVPFYDYDKKGKKSKSIVYFESNIKQQVFTGYKDLPTISSLELVNLKLHQVLETNKYFINM